MQNLGRDQRKAIRLNQTHSARAYTGRFAPSPTGSLHLGSLYTALARYLDARSHQGRWLLRIDDLDTPRNQIGATESIIDCLQAFGLVWDGDIIYQSQQLKAYNEVINDLQIRQQLYACDCSRKELMPSTVVYPGFCRQKNITTGKYALRVKLIDKIINFEDGLQGLVKTNICKEHGDFIVKRKDGIIAYQLAVVVDDYLQQINHIVRGCDLLDSTAKQIYLQQLLDYPLPFYSHVPIIVDAESHKLSKQTLAKAIDYQNPSETLFLLLQLLKQNPPIELKITRVPEILDWAISHWHITSLSALKTINQPE